MKPILVFLILLGPLTGQCQFSFEPNNDSTLFDKPYDSANIFEFKFTISSPWFYSSYLELTYNQDSIWNYKRYLIKNVDGERVELSPMDSTPNIGNIWNQLVELGFLTMKTEDEVTFKVIANGKLFLLPYETYQKMYPTDLANFVSELSNQHGTRTVMYYAPSEMLEKLQKSNQKWYVPELYKASFCYNLIMDTFKFEDYRNKFIELRNQEQTVKTKKGR
ncbi:hypothetical protein SAMN04488028_11218 [Reichenbachiella agariperforans]|uniref:Uncharacterized protein n=2 Tax=Reichenbachiella agariperforans TaxID=156994 RepID=A0A1M6WGE3_REIAG|nr:hypothetical protein SAMN04488028_11218 [Reichenbachiella agariperforans]